VPRNVHLRRDLADESALTAQIESLELSRGKYLSGMRFTVTPHSIIPDTHVAIGSLTIADRVPMSDA
jgi:hypothetical protein